MRAHLGSETEGEPPMARGEGDNERTEGHVPDSRDINPRATEQPKTAEPRIEQYLYRQVLPRTSKVFKPSLGRYFWYLYRVF